MKRFILALMGMAIFSGVFAQSNKEEIDYIQSVFGMEKKAIVNQFVTPDESQKEAFWTLYDEYETKRKELGVERIGLMQEYADKYGTMTNEEADAWMAKVLALQTKTNNLLDSYYKKVKKVTSPIVAIQFYQIESYILTAIRFQILDSMPFLGEFSK